MPKIGMRITKSAIAVFLCFLIYLIRGEGLPFYSTISAIICMQTCVENTLKAAKNRTVATIVGGIIGMCVLLFQRKYFLNASEPVLYFITSLAIIPTIYSMVLLDKKEAIATSCIVFLSITVNHAMDVNPYIFAINRAVDTLIGIFVALGVNVVPLSRKREMICKNS